MNTDGRDVGRCHYPLPRFVRNIHVLRSLTNNEVEIVPTLVLRSIVKYLVLCLQGPSKSESYFVIFQPDLPG
jgi:hypothetical protein